MVTLLTASTVPAVPRLKVTPDQVTVDPSSADE
jgi:hypothetical protein